MIRWTYEPRHEISNNVVCATSKASDQPAHTPSLIRAFASRLNIIRVKLLTEQHLEYLSLIEGCADSNESTLAKMPHSWKSLAVAHIIFDADPVGVDVCVSVTLSVLVCISHKLVDKFAWI